MSTNISWTHRPNADGTVTKGETWNPVTGCSHVSAGCLNCYAETLSLRHGWTERPWTARNADANVRLRSDRLEDPLHWRRPRMVFVNSMSDLFHPLVPDEFIAKVFQAMRGVPQHTFQILTKRPERMRAWVTRCADGGGLGWITHDGTEPARAFNGTGIVVGDAGRWPLPNVWLGVSCEDQENAEERIPPLLQTPAAVRFISAEPLLGPIDLSVKYFALRNGGTYPFPMLSDEHRTNLCELLDWVIVGGESGPDHRHMDIGWARELRDQCHQYGVPFFMKQDSGSRPGKQGRIPDELWVQQFPPVRASAGRA